MSGHEEAPARRRGMLVVLLLLAGCATPVPVSRSMSGTVTLENFEPTTRTGGTCRGTRGFDDVRDGLPVVVKDAASTIVGSTTLVSDAAYLYGNGCRFTFSVAGLPESGFYVVEVDGRGETTHSAAELDAAGWQVDLSIGR